MHVYKGERSMPTVFGDFLEADDQHEFLTIAFSASDIPLQKRWRNNGLSADFLANYWGTFFPEYDQMSLLRKKEMKNSIAYVANELLENTMKFHDIQQHAPISLKIAMLEEELRFYVTNCVSLEKAAEFQAYIQHLLTHNSEELYFEQIEKNARGQDETISRLGLLTLLNDYHAKLAWKFEQSGAETRGIIVTIMASIPILSP